MAQRGGRCVVGVHVTREKEKQEKNGHDSLELVDRDCGVELGLVEDLLPRGRYYLLFERWIVSVFFFSVPLACHADSGIRFIVLQEARHLNCKRLEFLLLMLVLSLAKLTVDVACQPSIYTYFSPSLQIMLPVATR